MCAHTCIHTCACTCPRVCMHMFCAGTQSEFSGTACPVGSWHSWVGRLGSLSWGRAEPEWITGNALGESAHENLPCISQRPIFRAGNSSSC